MSKAQTVLDMSSSDKEMNIFAAFYAVEVKVLTNITKYTFSDGSTIITES